MNLVDIITCILVFAIFRLLNAKIMENRIFFYCATLPAFLFCLAAPFLPGFIFKTQIFLICNAVFVLWVINVCEKLIENGKSTLYYFIGPMSICPFMGLFIVLNPAEIKTSNIFSAIIILIVYFLFFILLRRYINRY